MPKKKGVRSMNPADAHRKEQRKKEIKKNKAERMRVRKVAMAVKDTTKLEAELAELAGKEKQGLLDKNAKLKKQALEEKLNKIVETKKSMGVKYEPKSAKEEVAGTNSASEARDPTRSIYYHPLLNPHGTPPPGKPYREIEDGAQPAYPPPQKDSSDDESDEDEENDSDESEDSDEELNDSSEPAVDATQGSIEPHPSVNLTQPRPALGPDEPPPLPNAPRPEQRWNFFSCLPEQPAIVFPRKSHATVHPFPLRPPPMVFPHQHPSYPRRPPFPGQQYYPPPQMPPVGFPPMPPNAAYSPPPSMGIRPHGPMHSFAPPGQLPHQNLHFPPVYHYPPHAQQPTGFPGTFAPGVPEISPPNQRPPPTSHIMPYALAASQPKPASASISITVSSSPQAITEPATSSVISASPQIRDFQKEVTALVPTHLKRKRPAPTKTSAASLPTGTVRPSINPAPDLGDDDADDIIGGSTGPGSSTTISLVASIFGASGPKAKTSEATPKKTEATPTLSPLTVAQSKIPSAADEYARFMQEMGGLIEEK